MANNTTVIATNLKHFIFERDNTHFVLMMNGLRMAEWPRKEYSRSKALSRADKFVGQFVREWNGNIRVKFEQILGSEEGQNEKG